MGTSKYRYVIGGLWLGLNFAAGMNFFAIAPVLPLILEDYGASKSAGSFLIGLVPLVQAGLSIPGGILVSRLNLKWTVAVAWFISSALLLAPLAGDFATLLALRTGFGIGFSVIAPASGILLMQWFPRRERPLANGLMMVGGSLGVTTSLFLTAPLAAAVGWRGALMMPGAVMLAGAVLWVVFGGTATTAGEPVRRRVSVPQMLSTLRDRVTLLIALANTAPAALMVAQTSWLPTYFHESLGMSLSKAGLLTGILPFTGMFWIMLGGLLPLWFSRRRPFLLVPGLVTVFAGCATFLAGDTPFLFVALVGLSFACSFFLPTLLTMPMELPGMTPHRIAMVGAAFMTLGGIFTFISPLTVGILADVTGSYVPGFALWAVAALGLFVAALLLPETGVPSTAPDENAIPVKPATRGQR